MNTEENLAAKETDILLSGVQTNRKEELMMDLYLLGGQRHNLKCMLNAAVHLSFIYASVCKQV